MSHVEYYQQDIKMSFILLYKNDNLCFVLYELLNKILDANNENCLRQHIKLYA